jgi:hypothetical protein
MKNETKQTLISLSLAGAIGYYLYNKLVKHQTPTQAMNEHESAEKRTEQELSWRPPVVEEPVAEESNVVEPIAEECVADDASTMVHPEEVPEIEEQCEEVDNAMEQALENNFVAESTLVEEPESNLSVDPIAKATPMYGGIICPKCGEENADEYKFCQNCGQALSDETHEELVEQAVDLDVGAKEASVAEPVADEPDVLVEENIGLAVEDADNSDHSVQDAAATEEIMQDSPIEEISIENIDEDDEDEDSDASKGDAEEIKVMDNVEPLHKVDSTDEAAKQEFKSIMEFFNTL